MNNLQNLVGKPIRLKTKYIREWVFSHENWLCTQGSSDQYYADIEYDIEIMMAMFMQMGAPVWGYIKGVGNDCVLCMFMYNGLTQWDYISVENLVFLD